MSATLKIGRENTDRKYRLLTKQVRKDTEEGPSLTLRVSVVWRSELLADASGYYGVV